MSSGDWSVCEGWALARPGERRLSLELRGGEWRLFLSQWCKPHTCRWAHFGHGRDLPELLREASKLLTERRYPAELDKAPAIEDA